jgi:hypothetical protein
MNLDSAAIADAVRFKRCMQESFDEVLALAPSVEGERRGARRSQRRPR